MPPFAIAGSVLVEEEISTVAFDYFQDLVGFGIHLFVQMVIVALKRWNILGPVAGCRIAALQVHILVVGEV